VLWYDEGSPKGQSHADYENSMKRLGSFATVQVCAQTNHASSDKQPYRISGGIGTT
jgi:hypothetical protein